MLPEGTKIYRVVGRDSDPGGPYWSLEPPPATEAEWRAGSAVLDEWNPDGAYVEHTVGEGGLKVWVGETAGQQYDGNDFYLPGGEDQIFITPGSIPDPTPQLTGWPEP